MGLLQAPFTWTTSLTEPDTPGPGIIQENGTAESTENPRENQCFSVWMKALSGMCLMTSHIPHAGKCECGSARITPQEPGFTEDLHKSSCGAFLGPTGSNHYDSKKKYFLYYRREESLEIWKCVWKAHCVQGICTLRISSSTPERVLRQLMYFTLEYFHHWFDIFVDAFYKNS